MKLETVHKDERGEIYSLTGLQLFPEATVFVTKKGFARGGCIHRESKEFCCVIEGEIRYVTPVREYRMSVGGMMLIQPSTPHYFISITDSVVIEWGASLEEKKEKDEEFRNVVERINNVRLSQDTI